MQGLQKRLIANAIFALAPLLAVAAGATAQAGEHSPRQYYSGWSHHQGSSYHFRHYYYKPYEDYSGYKHHFVVYYPSHPQHMYYYNPYKRKFWGRCSAYGDGSPSYSRLPEEYQKPTLNEIPESAFPPPSRVPPIPEARDNAGLDLPPDDLPPGANNAPPGGANPGPGAPGPGVPGPAGAGPGPAGAGKTGPGAPGPAAPGPPADNGSSNNPQ